MLSCDLNNIVNFTNTLLILSLSFNRASTGKGEEAALLLVRGCSVDPHSSSGYGGCLAAGTAAALQAIELPRRAVAPAALRAPCLCFTAISTSKNYHHSNPSKDKRAMQVG